MTRFIPLLLLITLLSATNTVAAIQTLIDIGEGHHAKALEQGERAVTLIASEQQGLLRFEDQLHSRLLEGRFGQLDTRRIDDDKHIIALLDINTQATRLVSSDLNTVQDIVSIPAHNADIETLCLGRIDNTLMLFRADSAGQLHQTAIFLANQKVELVPVRTLNVGPGIKACSVHDASQTLYLADEFAGVWAMSANQESEIARTLLAHSPDYSVEAVSVSEDGILGWASPDAAVLHMRDTTTRGNTITLALQDNIAAETLHIFSRDNVLASVYDDNSGRIKQITIAGTDSTPTPESHASLPTLTAVAETSPVQRFGDAADDPAIWINQSAPEQSLILGTDKKAGLYVYDLHGKQRQFLPVGRVNNVDIRYNWQLANGETVDIAAATNRSDNSISLFGITPHTGNVTELGRAATGLDDVYGLCLFKHDERIDIFINDTDGRYQRFQLKNGTKTLSADYVSEFRLPSQPEGCVADDQTQTLYMGEESEGVWLANLAEETLSTEQIIQAQTPVQPDIEGMALYSFNDQNYLIVSSQGNNRFAVYDTYPPYTLLGVFGIDADWQNGIDGVSETDGLDTTSISLGHRFPNGILVVQDGRNVMPTENQNFKLVDGSGLKTLIKSLLK